MDKFDLSMYLKQIKSDSSRIFSSSKIWHDVNEEITKFKIFLTIGKTKQEGLVDDLEKFNDTIIKALDQASNEELSQTKSDLVKSIASLDKLSEVDMNELSNMSSELLDRIQLDSSDVRFEPILGIILGLSAIFATGYVTRENYLEYKNVIILRNMFSYFELYLHKCLEYILRDNPRLLSSRRIPLAEFIDQVKEKILDDIITKELHDLFYKKYKEIFNVMKKDYKFNHNLSNKHMKKLQYYKEVRNIYTHNDGIVNLRFLSNIDGRLKKYKEGDRVNNEE